MQSSILMYHHVLREVPDRSRPFALKFANFVKQLDILDELGYQTITLSQCREAPSAPKFVILTFDDCGKALWEDAIPELLRRKMAASFFVPTDFVGQQNVWDRKFDYPQFDLMDWTEIQQLARLGFEIGSHSHRHVNLKESPIEEIRAELGRSKSILEARTGCKISSFSYPFGKFPKDHAMHCEQAGYSAACSIFSRASFQPDMYCLRRTLIHDADTGGRFRFKLSIPYRLLRILNDRRILAE